MLILKKLFLMKELDRKQKRNYYMDLLKLKINKLIILIYLGFKYNIIN